MSRQFTSRPYTAWQLIKSYWQSEERLVAYLFLISAVIMTIGIVGMEVVFNNWYNYFYNALQDYDKKSTLDLIAIFLFLASIYIVIAVYRYYISQFLGLRWRRWLTDQFLNRWLEKRSYYYLENFNETTDNPDQRIQEDIGGLVSYSLDLSIGLINAIATIAAFIYILWLLSGTITLPLGKFGTYHVQGYLVWISLFYSAIGTYFSVKIGYPLVGLNFEQQRREANFRFAAVSVRSHAEEIALYRGEHHQKGILGNLFSGVLENWYRIILRQKLLLWFTAGYSQIAVILPLAVALPNYFGKVFKLGGLIQSINAFRQVQDAFSFIVTSYSRIAEWQAIMRRLITFLNHMYEVEHNAITKNKFIYETQPQTKITVKNLTLQTPLGETLLANINQEFLLGHNYLIVGKSGLGKSTFVRAIADIWPFGSGKIELPDDKSIMYIPQKLYMPIGTLKEAILFPDKILNIPDQTIQKLLDDCGLHELGNHLHEVEHWSEHLSPGEQQRIAIMRVILHKPKWVFLDETTSALDINNQTHLYELLQRELPGASIISVGHQASLEPFHEQQINLEKYAVTAVDA